MIKQERQIILSKVKYAEADLILKVINSDGEVYSVIAKSALKSRKRFGGGVLEPLHYINATVVRRSNDNELDRLSVINEAQLIDDFRDLRTDYDRLSLAFHFVQTVAKVAREGDTHPEIFNLLGHGLKAASHASDLSILKLRYDLKLLNLQGVLPRNDRFLPYIGTSIREDINCVGEGSDNSTSRSTHSLIREVELMMNNYLA